MKKSIISMLCTAVFMVVIFNLNNSFIDKNIVASVNVEDEDRKMPVIMYHSIMHDSSNLGKYTTTPEQVKSDILYLKEKGYEPVNTTDLINFVNDDGELPERPVMLTFDDGFYNNYLYVFPIIQEMHSKIVMSVVGIYTENCASKPEDNAYWAYLNMDEVKEMYKSGLVEIGNHSYNFHKNGERKGCLRKKGEEDRRYKTIFENDTLKNQQLLIDAGITAPKVYAYPYGALNGETEELLKKMGFECTLGCEEGINTITKCDSCLYRIKRYNRANGKTSAQFLGPIIEKIEKEGG